MPLLNFGQPFPGVMQTAYVVKDIREAIKEWVSTLNVGPWFLTEQFVGEHPVYRGQQSDAAIAMAHSFAGHMNIELIQPIDDSPSVYKELIDARGYGFHHWGVATSNVDADIARYEAAGMELAFRVGMSGGGDVAFMDTRGVMPGFVELIEMRPVTERALSRMYGAALTWDGSEPIRLSF